MAYEQTPAYSDPSYVTIAGFYNKVRESLNFLARGHVALNQQLGGSMLFAVRAEATGDIILPDWRPLLLTNVSSRFSGSTDKVAQVRFLCRVSNAGINVTPKIYNLTDAADATVSGTAACSATNEDYSGSNQRQTITLTVPAGTKEFQPRLTIAGTPAAGYLVWGVAIADTYINV